jgi:hypothetical protein
MDYMDIWRFANELRRGMVPTKHVEPIPHYDVWSQSEEAELARTLLFEKETEHSFTRGGVTGKGEWRFVWRKDGFYVKTIRTSAGYPLKKLAPTYMQANECTYDGELYFGVEQKFAAFKQSVVSDIREKVDRYVANVISHRLLKQYRDRDARLDRLFGTQDY